MGYAKNTQEREKDRLIRTRLLKIWEILQKETDEDHPMGTEALRARLTELGIEVHRTTLYEDIALLNEAGYEVLSRRGRSNQYYVLDRAFSNPELHILMDAVQAASFITEKKTAELVDKIAALAGSQRGLVLKRNIVQFNTAKSANESIYYSVDEIVNAINNGKKIIFLYFDYDEHHNKVYRRGGHHYVVSPFATVFSDGHYYLVIYDGRYKKMSHYRIDRMERVEMIDEPLELPEDGQAFDIANYKKQLFGMYSGKTTAVRLEVDRDLIGAIFDLFGESTKLVSSGEKTVTFTADVQLSQLFYGWCCSFGDKLRIVAPAAVVRDFAAYTEKLAEAYARPKEK